MKQHWPLAACSTAKGKAVAVAVAGEELQGNQSKVEKATAVEESRSKTKRFKKEMKQHQPLTACVAPERKPTTAEEEPQITQGSQFREKKRKAVRARKQRRKRNAKGKMPLTLIRHGKRWLLKREVGEDSEKDEEGEHSIHFPITKELMGLRDKVVLFEGLLNRRLDITHRSCASEVFKQLQEEGLVTIPQEVALHSITCSIWRKHCLYGIDYQFQVVKKLFTSVPCITVGTFYYHETRVLYYFLRKFQGGPGNTKLRAFYYFCELLFYMEPRFHPVIREENLKELTSIIERDSKIERRRLIQDWKNRPSIHFVDIIRQVEQDITSSKAYQDALKVVQLHQEFDKHIASSDIITGERKIEELMIDKRVMESRFEKLDKSLVKASLNARINLLKKVDEFKRYEAWLLDLIACRIEKGHSTMDQILGDIHAIYPDFPKFDWWNMLYIDMLKNPSLYSLTYNEMKDEISNSYKLLDKIKDSTACPASHSYLMEGILEYLDVCAKLEEMKSNVWQDPRIDVASRFRKRLEQLENLVWKRTYYEHIAYRIVYDDMSTIVG